jgi:regulator of protease activity HflC (stomatin/prohibitin superfamily)
VFADTPWYCEQPLREPIDLALSDEQILAQAEAIRAALSQLHAARAVDDAIAQRMRADRRAEARATSGTMRE